jgi:CRISPR/Cas system-associated endonuclease Cas1
MRWRTFGGRGSPIGNGPRLAGNPANAVLSYLYALLEAEPTLAARIVGLDPGLGVMHVNQAHRDSLSADLMEPVRPIVDAYAFDLLTSRPFAARDLLRDTRWRVPRDATADARASRDAAALAQTGRAGGGRVRRGPRIRAWTNTHTDHRAPAS